MNNCDLFCTFDLRSKALSFGKTKKYLVFRSLIRTFAAARGTCLGYEQPDPL